MRRQTTLLLGLGLLLLVVLAAGLFLIYQSSLVDEPEKQASEAARSEPALPPAAPVDALGSGLVVRGTWYEVAFTAPRYPDDRANHRGGLDERLVALMDRASQTLDVAIYDFDLANVADAMVRAAQRGVRVRMVTDTDTLTNTRDSAIQDAFARLKAGGIPVVADQRQAIMHHKFTVVDGEWIQTGSWNYTDGDTYRLNNNQFIAQSRELAANYTAEFEKMFVQRKFGPSKSEGAPYPRLTVGGSQVETYFAPEDEVATHLIRRISEQQRRSLYFLAFSFTHDGLGRAMIDQAQRGATVQGVFETTGSNTQFSEYQAMKKSGLDVYQDGNPYVMHHKVIIVDDRTVAFGSFNFSANADESNDENLLIVEDQTLAQAFKTEFDRVLTLAQNPPARQK